MKKKFYHATPWENYKSILSNGIKLNRLGEIFLSDSMENAAKFLFIRGIYPVAIFELELDEELVRESFDHSEKFFKCKAWTYDTPIKPEEILEIYQYTIT